MILIVLKLIYNFTIILYKKPKKKQINPVNSVFKINVGIYCYD